MSQFRIASASPCQSRRRRSSGFTLILVMSLISISLAVTYSVMRSQATTLMIQGNSNSRAEARHAALAGLSIALSRMHDDDWAGVDSIVAGNLSTYESYNVTYATGDPSLAEGDADYNDYPFRVTVLSTGMSTSQPGSTASHTIRAVVQLVPRALSSQPSAWSDIANYTVYQHQAESTYVYPPVHIEGPVRLRGRLYWGEQPWFSSAGYSWSGTEQFAYLRGLEVMRQASGNDYRPMSGPIHLPYSDQPYGLVNELANNQSVATSNASDDPLLWTTPVELNSYQLYPGGKTYQVETAASTIQYTSVEPDLTTNPLGLRYRSSNIEIKNSSNIKGTLISSDDIEIDGRSVNVEPVSLPPIYGSTSVVQLPVAIALDDIRIDSHAEAAGNGMIICGDEFEVQRGLPTTEFNWTGRLLVGELHFMERSTWDVSSLVWNAYTMIYNLFKLTDEHNTQFPAYLILYGLDPDPKIKLSPPADDVTYHWPTANTPIYVPHPDDGGLRWEMIEWTDGVH